MLETDFEIPNTLGLHARAAAKLVAIASRFPCTITVTHNQRSVDARNIMGLLTLGATKGTVIHIRTEGKDYQTAFEEIQSLFARNFDEDEEEE